MVTFKNGILTFYRDFEKSAKTIFEIMFVVNTIAIFAFIRVAYASSVTALLLFLSSLAVEISSNRRVFKIRKSVIWYGAVTLYCTVSYFWNKYFISADLIKEIISQVVILAIITSISFYVETVEDYEKLISLFIFSIFVIVCLEAISTPYNLWYNGQMGSHFSGGNSNTMGFIVACAELMAFYKAYVKGEKKLIYYALAVIFLFFVMLTSSRKSFAMGVAGPCLMLLFYSQKKMYGLRILISIIAVTAVITIMMSNDDLYNVIGKRLNMMYNYYSGTNVNGADNSIYEREAFIDIAKEIFMRSPLIGSGSQSFPAIVSREYGMFKTYAHNNYWEVLSELGIIGFIIYYSMYAYILIKLVKSVFIEKKRSCVMSLTFMVMLMIIEYGMVTISDKYSQIIIAITFTSTYITQGDGRKYSYVDKRNLSIN